MTIIITTRRITLAVFFLLSCAEAPRTESIETKDTRSPLTPGPVVLGALDCLPVGVIPVNANGQLPPSLPFYQPKVTAANIDSVVVTGVTTPNNHFNVLHNWNGAGIPIVPVSNWIMDNFTGFSPGVPYANSQRAQVDSYAESGIQASGLGVGMWLNSMNAGSAMERGSKSLNVGCWYNTPPYAPMFPSLANELDISFELAVARDSSVGNGVTLAYFQTIAIDRTGGGKFSISIEVYSRDANAATTQEVKEDHTGTLDAALVRASIDSTGWFRKMPDSISFQTAPFAAQRVHVRMSANELMSMRNAAVSQFPALSGLSTNPLDYELSLLNVNGEVYDPCKDNSDGGPLLSCNNADHAQLGMSVHNFRVISTIPHQASGVPSGFNGLGPNIVFRDTAGNIRYFSNAAGNGLFNLTILATANAIGDPMGYFGGSAPRIVYLDNTQHVREISYWNGAWTAWDMNSIPGSVSAFSNPRGYVDGTGSAHVVYRDFVGDVREHYLDSTGWNHANISALVSGETPAFGGPTGYLTGSTSRIVYRDTNNHIREMSSAGSTWSTWDMNTLPGSANAYSDPRPYVDPAGFPHVVYRDIVGNVHEHHMDASGWKHSNVSTAAGAPPALGSPMGYVAGSAPRIVYYGVDSHIHELVYWASNWTHTDLTATVRGALQSATDPVGFVDSDGIARVNYRGTDNQLHEFYYSSAAGWLHRDQ